MSAVELLRIAFAMFGVGLAMATEAPPLLSRSAPGLRPSQSHLSVRPAYKENEEQHDPENTKSLLPLPVPEDACALPGWGELLWLHADGEGTGGMKYRVGSHTDDDS